MDIHVSANLAAGVNICFFKGFTTIFPPPFQKTHYSFFVPLQDSPDTLTI
jgi:hypothetical protein